VISNSCTRDQILVILCFKIFVHLKFVVMAGGVNKVILIGNLGRDPEIQNFENSLKKATFSIATTESYKAKDGNRVDHVEWHRIVLWRGLAEVAEKYLRKGNQVYIEGRLRTRQWEDKEGVTKYTTEIEGLNMTMLGGRRDQEPVNNPPATAETVEITEEKDGDDLPF